MRLSLLILGLLTACSSVVSPVPSTVLVSAQPAVVSSSPETSPHPVSLEAFRQKVFDGGEFTLGRVLARTDSYVRHYITYRSGTLTISGILNIPTGDGPFPLLVLNHGYIDPAIYTNGRGLKREQDYLAKRGFAVLHPDYRNHADSSKDPKTDLTFRMGYAEDVINGILALQEAKLPRIDASRVGMLGHSMGGGVTQMVLVTRPDLVDAAVMYAAVSSDVRDNFHRWTETRPEVAANIVELYGAPEDDPAFWNGISPQNFFDRVEAPVLIHHGTADESVPIEWSERLEKELRVAGVQVTYHVYEGEPHEFAAAWPLMMERTAAFFIDAL